MAGTSIEVIKKWIGHGNEEMIRRYTHLGPDFMHAELEKVPDFGPKITDFDPIDPRTEVTA
jgi:hypothetical protein